MNATAPLPSCWSCTPSSAFCTAWGALLLRHWLGAETRPTRDIDLLGPVDLGQERLRKLLGDLLRLAVEDDGIEFSLDSMTVRSIRAESTVLGLRAKFDAHLGPTRLRYQVDVGLGDAVFPSHFFWSLGGMAMETMNTERVRSLARDLRTTPPRSPRETLGGFVIGARMVDKARADLLGIHGEYNFFPCGLGAYFWTFTGLDAPKFKDFVATGASAAEVDEWIRRNAVVKDKLAVIRWNNEMAGLRLCDLTDGVQEYFSTYIPQFCKPASKVKFFFDVYDVEEGVL